MTNEIKRRSARSPAGEQRRKIPITLNSQIEERIRKEAGDAGVSLSFYLSQIIEGHYGKRSIDPVLTNLIRRVDSIEARLNSGQMPAIEEEQYEISDDERRDILQRKAELDLSNNDIADEAGLSPDLIKQILKGEVTQVAKSVWEKLNAAV